MTPDPIKSQGDSEVFRFGGFGTVLLISLLAFIGLYPLMLGEIAGRLAGGLILGVILVSSAVAASRSRAHRVIGVVLAIFALGLQVDWLETHSSFVEAADAAIFATFFLYTALLIFRHVLSFGPVYADRVHAALSVYILLALAWAFIYGLIEILSPGAFLLVATSTPAAAPPEGAYLLADMIHLSIATLTSTGYGDITPIAPFARSMSQLEQLVGVFYIAVLISRLVGLYPSDNKV
jgi:Ion channel